MAPSKKRGGQKRRGSKAKGSKSAAPGSPSEGLSNGITNNSTASQSSAPPMATQDFGPADVTPIADQGDTKVNSQQPDGQISAGAGDRRNGGPPPPRPLADRKENAAPPKTYSSVTQSQSPALKPLVVENQAQPQDAGTRSQYATTTLTSSNKPEMPENVPLKKEVEELGANIASLTLDAASRPDQPPELKPTSTAVAPKVSTIPAPIVVVLPLTDKAAAPKPAPAPVPNLPGLIEPKTEEERVERAHHLKFMREALSMGNLALNTNETPVGCVLVYRGRVIAKGMNATNVTRNGTRHAEFMALSALLSRKSSGDIEEVNDNRALDDASWGDVDPSNGHIFPYGQKLHPAPVVNREIISECILYVTVEPCVMCASLLRQLGIKKVYFGAVNDKFGGTGGVFKIHMNSKPVSKSEDRPYQNGYGPQDVERIVKGRPGLAPRDEDDGDGGNVEHGFPVEGGYLRDDAVSLLRRFYVQENGRAPQPRKKEGRAARLFAMENQTKNSGNSSEFSDSGTLLDAAAEPDIPADDGQNMMETTDSPITI